MGYTKHRDEEALYEMSFAARLNTGETLTVPTVRVEQSVLYEWVDVTADVFVTDSEAVAPGAVQFVLGPAASEAVQRPGTYRVVIAVDTSANQHLIGIVPLAITG